MQSLRPCFRHAMTRQTPSLRAAKLRSNLPGLCGIREIASSLTLLAMTNSGDSILDSLKSKEPGHYEPGILSPELPLEIVWS